MPEASPSSARGSKDVPIQQGESPEYPLITDSIPQSPPQCFTERWVEGFRKDLYRGRTGGYYESESGLPFKERTKPEILVGVNIAEPATWDDALRMRNSKNGVAVDAIYVGLTKGSHERVEFSFDANLPSPAGLTDLYVGFEVNSGGGYANIASLSCIGGSWYLRAVNHKGVFVTPPITLRNLGVFARYKLIYNPPYLILYEAPVGVPSGFPLEKTATLFLSDVRGRVIPFFANEELGRVCEFQIGNFWVDEIIPLPCEFTLQTDKDVYFTGAIAQWAKEDENITGLLSDKVTITDVAIEADENLSFRLLFWATDGFDDTDLDADTFLGGVALDLPTNGFRIGAANQYYLNVSDLHLHYRDDDYTNELHISLQCLTAAGKSAGANGEVVVKIGYKLEE